MAVSKTTLELSEPDLALLRKLLFRELHDAAEILAEEAGSAAFGGNADPDDSSNIAGDEAQSTHRHRVQVAAALLDEIGWSVLTDMATLVAFERSRRVGGE